MESESVRDVDGRKSGISVHRSFSKFHKEDLLILQAKVSPMINNKPPSPGP